MLEGKIRYFTDDTTVLHQDANFQTIQYQI